MKKLFIIAVVLTTGLTVNEVAAQTGPLAGTTTLSVTLAAAQSITVNQAAVELSFTKSADYLNGVSAPQANHLTFASTSGFTITATAATDLTGGIGDDISINTVTITPTAGDIGTLPDGTAEAKALIKASPVTIFTSGPGHTAGAGAKGGTTQASLDIDYKAKQINEGDYLNRTGKFSSIITYTIAPN